MFKTQYRIVTNAYRGYEVQFKYWWMPFYVMLGINTCSTLEEARDIIQRQKVK